MQSKARVFVLTAFPVLAADRITKLLALRDLQPPHIAHQALGNVVRWTLVFNRDAAMNLSLGPWSRWGFALIALLGVALMLRLLQVAPGDAVWRAVGLALVAAGATGNLIDRLQSDRGVIDFIDVGVGTHRFWTFNVADAGVTMGALVLAVVFSREPRVPTHRSGA
jgi:signal peptidase II